MGSCSNKGIQTKDGIQEVMITKPSNPPIEIPQNSLRKQITTRESQEKRNIEALALNSRKSKEQVKHKEILKLAVVQKATELQNAEVSNPKKSPADIELIEKCLKRLIVFNKLNDAQLKEILNEMRLYSLDARQSVFTEKQPGTHFYIVAKGLLQVTISQVPVGTLEPGNSFGEGALLQNSLRSASVNTIEPSLLWGLDRKIFCKIVKEVNAANYEENMKFIENTSVFKDLTLGQKEALVECLTIVYFNPGSHITREGDTGDLLYIIKEGNALYMKNGQEICRFSKGDCFGEQALFFQSTRTATITAIDTVICIGITSESLTKVLGNRLQDLIYKNTIRLAILNNQYLKKLTKLQEDLIISSMVIGDFTAGEIVIPAGTMKQSDLMIVIKGCLKTPEGEIQVLKCIGEKAIIENSNETWTGDVTAKVNSTLGFMSKGLFETSIGGKYEECVGNNNKIKLLKHIPLFRALTSEQYNRIIQAMKAQEFSDGCIIFEENDPGESLFIIKSGKVDIFKNGTYVRSVGKNDYFGERSILFSSSRTATVMANGRVIVWVLFRADFLQIINDKIRYNLIKRIELQDETIQLSDLKIVKLLGRGLTGIVFLVVHKQKKILFALKTVHRQKIYDYDMYDSIRLERQILLQLDHAFIMKLVKTFKDPKRIFFLTEYVRGKDLFEVIRIMNFISEPNARFFVGCLMLVLEDLHEKTIVYRDLKPENVVVDDEGYLKVIDFGTAKFVKGRTFTVLGTPQYMAPEVILTTGYSFPADYWSLGIMMFEFLFGYVPFGENDNDPMVVYEKVLERNIEYPPIQGNFYIESRQLVEQLLSENPNMRTGGSAEILKNHAWFKGFDWELLLSRQMEAPHLPKVTKNDKEIENALTATQDIDEIISREEDETTSPELGCDPGWDEHF